MRKLREFGDESLAQRVADALCDKGIACDVRASEQGTSLWVHDELDMERAQTLALAWLDGADGSELEQAAKQGRLARERGALSDERERRRLARAETAFQQSRGPRPTPLTLGLIALCAGVYFLTSQDGGEDVSSALWIADPRATNVSRIGVGSFSFYWLNLPWREPWRFLTPIVVHATTLHIVFNMLWLHSLGSLVERRHGSFYLLAFIVTCGALSNVAQYEIGKSPAFAGMSGVVYGLLGLIWLRGRLGSRVDYALSPMTMQFMLLWLALGFVVPGLHTANWCHLGGLAVGCAWAALASLRPR